MEDLFGYSSNTVLWIWILKKCNNKTTSSAKYCLAKKTAWRCFRNQSTDHAARRDYILTLTREEELTIADICAMSMWSLSLYISCLLIHCVIGQAPSSLLAGLLEGLQDARCFTHIFQKGINNCCLRLKQKKTLYGLYRCFNGAFCAFASHQCWVWSISWERDE